jgi:protein-export SecD/SecF family membrane protein
MKGKRRYIFPIIILLLLAFSAVTIQQAYRHMDLGLDLRGGVYVLLKATDVGDDGGGDVIDRAITVIRNRIDGLGVSEPVIQREGDDRIRIELAGIEDPESAMDVIGKTAMLRFIAAEDDIILDGKHIREASVTDGTNGRPAITLELTVEGIESQAEVLEAYAGEGVYLNDRNGRVKPLANLVMDGGRVLLEAEMTEAEAESTALLLNSGVVTIQPVNLILTGGHLKDAYTTFVQQSKPAVALQFTPEGTTRFAEATERYIGRIIAIYLDEKLVSMPEVQAVISDGQATIEGSITLEEARNTALMLRSGALPVDLVELETRSVGPTLGTDSLSRSVRAGIAGIALILLFMVFYYRFFGMVASVALVVYLAVVFGLLTAINATLTLPGIAGLILSMGMAVDANVIIFERIKEELLGGRTMRTSVDAGFERAFRAILDANVTTFIAVVVLFNFGTGPIRGFAVTLGIGIVASMFSAILLVRYLLRQAVRADLLRTPENSGVRG